MTMKIAVISEHEDKKDISLKPVTFAFVAKTVKFASSGIFLISNGYASECPVA